MYKGKRNPTLCLPKQIKKLQEVNDYVLFHCPRCKHQPIQYVAQLAQFSAQFLSLSLLCWYLQYKEKLLKKLVLILY